MPLLNVRWQSNAAAVGDASAVDKTLSDVVRGVSKLTADDTTCRTVAGTAAVSAVGMPPASHLSSQDTPPAAVAVAPVSNRLLLALGLQVCNMTLQ